MLIHLPACCCLSQLGTAGQQKEQSSTSCVGTQPSFLAAIIRGATLPSDGGLVGWSACCAPVHTSMCSDKLEGRVAGLGDWHFKMSLAVMGMCRHVRGLMPHSVLLPKLMS